MNVRMRENIRPLCDRDFTPMELTRIEAKEGGMRFSAYLCKSPGCTRAYENALGYRDIVENVQSFEDQVRRQCPKDQTNMFVSSIDRELRQQTWMCAQVDCNHSDVVREVTV